MEPLAVVPRISSGCIGNISEEMIPSGLGFFEPRHIWVQRPEGGDDAYGAPSNGTLTHGHQVTPWINLRVDA